MHVETLTSCRHFLERDFKCDKYRLRITVVSDGLTPPSTKSTVSLECLARGTRDFQSGAITL